MNALFKKYFWAVHLVFLALLAWAAAATVDVLVGAALFVAPEPPSDLLDEGRRAASAELGRVTDEAAGEELDQWKVFDLNPPDYEEQRKKEEQQKEKEEGDEAKEDEDEEKSPEELEESELPIELVGTAVGPNRGTSMATLKVDGEPRLVRVGTPLLDGKATVAAITPRHVVVEEGEELRVVKLWPKKKDEAKDDDDRVSAAKRRRLKRKRARRRARRRSDDDDDDDENEYEKGVEKKGPYEYEIDEDMLDEQLKNLDELGKQARVVPNYKDGKYEGFKLVGVRPGSLYRSIGIRSGDVVKSINGQDINSPNKAMQLFRKLKNSNDIRLNLDRRGQTKQLKYNIR